MASSDSKPEATPRSSAQAPFGYVLIPISAEQAGVPLQLCAVVREKADPVGGQLVVLRDTIDARVLLGCVADAGGRVRQWVELWVQSLDAMEKSVPASREALSNYVLDKRWVAQV